MIHGRIDCLWQIMLCAWSGEASLESRPSHCWFMQINDGLAAQFQPTRRNDHKVTNAFRNTLSGTKFWDCLRRDSELIKVSREVPNLTLDGIASWWLKPDWRAASMLCRSIPRLDVHGWTCSFSSWGTWDRTSGQTWLPQRQTSPQGRRMEKVRRSSWLNFTFAFVQLNEFFLAAFSDGLVRNCCVFDWARVGIWAEASSRLLQRFRSVFELLDFTLKWSIAISHDIKFVCDNNSPDTCSGTRLRCLEVQKGQEAAVCVRLQWTTRRSSDFLEISSLIASFKASSGDKPVNRSFQYPRCWEQHPQIKLRANKKTPKTVQIAIVM